MKRKKKRALPMIAPPVAVVGVEIALSRHLLFRAECYTEILELSNEPEERVEYAIAIEDDLRNRLLYTEQLRIN